MVRITEDDDGETTVGKRLRGLVHFRDEGARRVDDLEFPLPRKFPDPRSHPMRGKDDGLAHGDILDPINEPEAEFLQLTDDDFVVNKFVKTVDVPELERLGNCRVDARAHPVRL